MSKFKTEQELSQERYGKIERLLAARFGPVEADPKVGVDGSLLSISLLFDSFVSSLGATDSHQIRRPGGALPLQHTDSGGE